MRAVIYTRISDARDEDTAGVDRQREDCFAFCAERSWHVIEVFEDNNVSAMKRKTRPAYAAMLAEIEQGHVDVVVCYASDRLYRRLSDLEELTEKLGPVKVATVKSGKVDLSTADGRLMANVLGSVAQHESEKRGERVARAARQRAEAGRFNGGGRRLGYTPSMDALVESEAEAIEWGYSRILAGGSLREVAKEWAARGLLGTRGKEISPGMVKTILLRPANAGLSVYRGEIVGTTNSPAIIDEAAYRQAQAILTDPRRRSSPDDGRRTLLSGVLVCGVCGGPVRAHNRARQRNGRLRTAYACSQSRCVTRSRDRLDEAVTELVLQYLIEHRSTYRKAPRTASMAAQRASDEAETLRKRLADLAVLVGGGQLEPQDFAAAAREVRERLAEADSRVARHAGTPATSKLIKSSDIRAAWASASSRVRRAVIREVVESITLSVGTPGKFTMAGTVVKWRDQA